MERPTHANRLGADRHDEMHTSWDSPMGQQARTVSTQRTDGEGFADQLPKTSLAVLLGTVAAGFVLRRALGGSEEIRKNGAAENDLLLAWLNDAYAMEKAQIPILENHAKDAKDYPNIRKKDLQHLEQTRRHAEMVKSCIERLGGKPSTSKKTLGTVIGNLGSVSTGPFEDELVKNFLSDYATENLEIASYRALITAAQELGDRETARICKQILRDEEEMARWLEDNLPMAVRETLRSH
ncbi:hypothetical protein BH24GEM3_BH24GEM3_06450 [soil metagenome]